MKTFLLALLVPTLITASLEQGRVEASYACGEWIGIEENYGEVELFVPHFLTGERLVFAAMSAYLFEKGQWGGSGGIGYRNRISDTSILGANLFIDTREGKTNRWFSRLGLGIEWLHFCFDLRMNGYLPFGRNAHRKHKLFTYPSGYFANATDLEWAIDEGFDAEIGLPMGCWGDFFFYGAAGPYYYRHHREDSFWGGQGRLEIEWNYLSLQIRTSYDEKFQSRTQGRLLLSLPFELFYNTSCQTPCKDPLTQSVRRNGILFLDRHCRFKSWNW